jgi:hypothetical protein
MPSHAGDPDDEPPGPSEDDSAGALVLPSEPLESAGGAVSLESAAQAKGPSPVASHATAGVVKSIGATTLVITRSGRHGGDMAFVLNPSTHREGAIETGFHVSVRYREEGQAHVATAVMGQEARKPQAAAGTTQGAR